MKEESTLRRFRRALAAIAVGLVGGLTWDSPESWAQAPATPRTVEAPAGPVVVKVEGEVSTPLRLTAAELNQLPRQTVMARAHDEKESRFEGIALSMSSRKRDFRLARIGEARPSHSSWWSRRPTAIARSSPCPSSIRPSPTE